MESKRIRSSVIARSMRLNGLIQPLHQDKLTVIERQNQPKESKSSFMVVPTKELCRVHLQKPNLLASKGIIDARTKPPHYQISKSVGSRDMANNKRFDQQNLKLKPKTGKKDSSLRCFSPLGFGSASGLREKKKGQCFDVEKESNERKKLCDGSSQEKERVVGEVSSKLMVNTSRDSALGFERNCNERVAKADVKLRHASPSDFITKDGNENSLDCSNASPGCQMNSEEAHQPSPVSVLEPLFYEDVLDDDDERSHLDFQQLDTLDSQSENYSDENGMEVSSDEESVFDSVHKESKDSEPVRLLVIQESKESSYIDDILEEVVLGNGNQIPDKWDSMDLVVTPKTFEKLEKKYNTETSWKRLERRILFDRVISGLVEFQNSFKATPTWKTPVCRRLGTVLTTCVLKQEIWKVLARQEKRAKKEPSAQMPIIDTDEWLELEADDESVVCELESMLVDELLAEVVSLM